MVHCNPKVMKIVVTGDRNWTDREKVRQRLSTLPLDSIVIHGGARGLDTIAGEEAQSLGLTVIRIDANWKVLGRAAGPIRNREMLNHRPDLVIGFHPDLTKSKGTANCLAQAHRLGLKVEVIS